MCTTTNKRTRQLLLTLHHYFSFHSHNPDNVLLNGHMQSQYSEITDKNHTFAMKTNKYSVIQNAPFSTQNPQSSR